MIRAVLFDYGGVMSEGGKVLEASEKLAVNLDIPPSYAREVLGLVWDDFSRGKTNEETLWVQIEGELGRKVDISQRKIWNTWNQEMKIIPEMRELVTALRAKQTVVGLLSNVVPPAARDIEANGGYDIFDFTVLSCEVGLDKPDPAIYHLALAKLAGINPHEVVFIDDQQRFLDPAAGLGMQTILAASPEQIRQDLDLLVD